MIAVLVTVVWAAATFTFNSIAGTDYGFLNGKPHTASLLERYWAVSRRGCVKRGTCDRPVTISGEPGLIPGDARLIAAQLDL
jgi:hypothetical protein